MVKKVGMIVGGVVLAAIAVVLCIAITKPDEFVIVRSTEIKAPPEKIFAVIGDFHRSPEWSPWETLDPQIKRTYSGNASGKGAKYAWDGNDEVGEGSMEVIEFAPPTKMAMNLHFVRPMQGDNLVEYVLEPQGDQTKMTWSMRGPNQFMGKIFQVFVNCDTICGQQFEHGLAKLKTVCEK